MLQEYRKSTKAYHKLLPLIFEWERRAFLHVNACIQTKRCTETNRYLADQHVHCKISNSHSGNPSQSLPSALKHSLPAYKSRGTADLTGRQSTTSLQVGSEKSHHAAGKWFCCAELWLSWTEYFLEWLLALNACADLKKSLSEVLLQSSSWMRLSWEIHERYLLCRRFCRMWVFKIILTLII